MNACKDAGDGKLWIGPGTAKTSRVTLRALPYPYRAAIALASDADFVDVKGFDAMYRFLNSSQPTPIGNGIELPAAGNFFLFHSPDSPNRLSFFNGLTTKASACAGYLRQWHDAGWLDGLHSFGCFTRRSHFSRELAKQGLEALTNAGIKVDVWVDHGSSTNVQNLGPGPGFEGDLPASAAYHLDLTQDYGVRFFWLGDDVAEAVGQFIAPSRTRAIAAGLATVARTRRFELYATGVRNSKITNRRRLRDGSLVSCFTRFGGVRATPVCDDLSRQLSERNLRRLEQLGGFMILYQHFGVRRRTPGYGIDCYRPNEFPYFSAAERNALVRLADRHHQGRILVTTTSRLLRYCCTLPRIAWRVSSVSSNPALLLIKIEGISTPGHEMTPASLDALANVTFLVPDDTAFLLEVGGHSRIAVARSTTRTQAGRGRMAIRFLGDR